MRSGHDGRAGWPVAPCGVEDKVARDATGTAADTGWIKMIIPDEAAPDVVAGNVVLWSHGEGGGEAMSEIGWMVLPEFQGRGLGKRAVRMLLELPATMAAGDSSTRSRRRRTPRQHAVAGHRGFA